MPNSNTATGTRPSRLPSRKLAATGVIAGAAAGAWLAGRLRSDGAAEPEAQQVASRPMVDWEQARSIAINMNRGATLTAPERAELDAYYRQLVATCVPIVGNYMGVQLPPGAGAAYAFDRVDWINANIDAFRRMLAPFEPFLAGSTQPGSAFAAIWGGVNRRVVGAELGVLLGYLARRVLGQYDVALLGREPVDSGKLYYVEPNIRHLETTMKLPAEDFRTWLALHETTHVFQFEAFPWVRPYFNEMLDQYFGYLQKDAAQLSESVKNLKVFVDRVRSRDRGSGSWLEALMNDEQRALFARMQAMMCIIEGYSNHVMNAVGKQLLSNYEMISRKFEMRQRNRSQAEQIFARITGLDMKIEQYRQGQAFVDQIVATRGHDIVLRVWDGPESVPTLEEIREPQKWLARVVDKSPV